MALDLIAIDGAALGAALERPAGVRLRPPTEDPADLTRPTPLGALAPPTGILTRSFPRPPSVAHTGALLVCVCVCVCVLGHVGPTAF